MSNPLQNAQNIVDSLFFDDKAITGWQKNLLSEIILIAESKLIVPKVQGRKERLIDFLTHLNTKGLINNHDFDYEKEVNKYLKSTKN
jgi:hypothetical protein